LSRKTTLRLSSRPSREEENGSVHTGQASFIPVDFPSRREGKDRKEVQGARKKGQGSRSQETGTRKGNQGTRDKEKPGDRVNMGRPIKRAFLREKKN
jgi:hypothetical protein